MAQPADNKESFRIVDVAATGAYGTVCVAELHGPGEDGRVVAIKALHRSHVASPNVVRRSRDEARLLMRLDHPSLVRVENLVHIHGRPVLVMEWVDGATLRELLADFEQGLPPNIALHIARQAALGLQYAATAPVGDDGAPMQVVHRDVKPSNILLSVHGDVKVVDFGTARGTFDDREATTQATLMGSMGYIAPERLDNAPDTPAVDIYALGITLFELLCRHCPALPRNPVAHDKAMAHHLRNSLPGGTPEPLQQLIAEMTAAERERRPDYHRILARIDELLAKLDPLPDLREFADAHVRPIRERAPRVPLARHPEADELSFLESTWDDATMEPPARVDVEADQQLRAMLEQPDWHRKSSELLWLLAMHPAWGPEPFLEILDAALERPFWKLWGRPHRAEVLRALDLVRHRPSPEVCVRAEQLFRWRNPQIRRAAGRVLVRCRGSDQDSWPGSR